MDLALSIVDVLRQIHELRDAIRRQRHVNHRTYLRMMEIYVELHSSDAVQVNATLTRTATLNKFSAAVTKFLLYLQKYNDMHKVIRLFKFTTMEEQRLKIVDEIDQLYRMLNLATAVAVMNGAAAASSNAARLFAKIEDMHGTIQLTHDQIHDALLADKQQVVVSRKRLLHHEEPVIEKISANRGALERAIEPLAAMMEEGTDEQKEEAARALEHLVVKGNDATAISETLLGYFGGGAISQNANVAATAARNTIETVREGVIPLIRRFVNPDVEVESKAASQNLGSDTRADTKSGNKGQTMAGAW
ncbi:hypothetical protein PF011_g22127 [Phytophthora fragariae]|uniref:Uncharacterized protein n=1 Tax=Phytophthora fragariae TaxID=53985 RepID=A0A6A3IG72_9STRA|nr:hypothetical protein PF011_g22127 [Phytophthora fragariae]